MVLSGNFQNLPEAFGTFQDPSGPFSAIPGPFGMVLGCSGSSRTTSRTFRYCLGMFQNYLDRFRDDPSYSLIYPMTAKVVGTPSDYPKTIPVDPGLPQYHSHMFQHHLGLLQSDLDISLNTQNYFRCPYEQFYKYPELLSVPV